MYVCISSMQPSVFILSLKICQMGQGGEPKQNSIYIEPFLSHNDIVGRALKSSTVKRNDTGLQLASQKWILNITL